MSMSLCSLNYIYHFNLCSDESQKANCNIMLAITILKTYVYDSVLNVGGVVRTVTKDNQGVANTLDQKDTVRNL